MIELTLTDSNFGHQEYLNPHIKSEKVVWKRDGVRRKINVYTDNFIKSTHVDIPQDGNYNICLLIEPYTNPAWTDVYDYIQTDFEKFDLIITHNLEKLGHLIESRPDKFVYSSKCLTFSWMSDKFFGLHNKTKNISMRFSYKGFSEGHQLRHAIYKKYKDSGIIDFYGSGPEVYVPSESGECFIDYKYIIVCENTLQKGFNSEKFYDALLTGCIPIYWGSDVFDENIDKNSILKFSPNKNIINFEFDESLENLEKILDYIIANDPYNDLIESVKKNYEYAVSKHQGEENLLEILRNRNMIDF